MTDSYDFSQHKINLGDTNYPQKHNAAMDALEQLGNDTVQRAQEAAHHAAIAAKRVMTKPEFDTIRQNEIRSLLGAGFKKTDFDNDYEFSQVNGWQNKFKIKANEIVIDGVWHRFNDTVIELHEAPNGLQNIDLSQPDFPNIAAAIVAGGTSLSSSYLNQREIVIAVQKDIAVTAPNATNTVFIQDTDNHVYSDNGVLRQRVLSFVVERLPESVPCASKNNAWRDCKNAMSALGWTQTDIVGQWKREDKIAVGITWVQRSNRGASHPLNAFGCGKVVNDTVNSWTEWHTKTARKPLTISDCFAQYEPNENQVTGAVADTTGLVGSLIYSHLNSKWNGEKFFDAVYPSGVQDLRINVNKVQDTKVLFDYSYAPLSADLRGHESVPFTRVNSYVTISAYSVSRVVQITDTSEYSVGDYVTVVDTNNDIVMKKVKLTQVESSYIGWDIKDGSYNRLDSTLYWVVHESQRFKHTSEFPTWTEIIGTPENIAATAANLGVDGFYGIWTPVIPDGTFQPYPLSRKSDAPQIDRVITDDNGVTLTGGLTIVVDTTLNRIRRTLLSNRVEFLSYKTKAHFTEQSDNRPLTVVGDVHATSAKGTIDGNLLMSSLIGKIGTGGDIAKTTPLTYKTIRNGTFVDDGSTWKQEHLPIKILGTGPAVKTITSLVEVDGMMALQFNFKEMKYGSGYDNNSIVNVLSGVAFNASVGTPIRLQGFDNASLNGRVFTTTHNFSNQIFAANIFDSYSLKANGDLLNSAGSFSGYKLWDGDSWGDDNKVQITDGVSTLPDENGNHVKYGTHLHVLNIPHSEGI